MYCKKCGSYNSNSALRCQKCKDYLVNQYLNNTPPENITQNNCKLDEEQNNQENIKKRKQPRKSPQKSRKTKTKKKTKIKHKNEKQKNTTKTEVIYKNSLSSKVLIFFLILTIIALIAVSAFLGLYILNDKLVKVPDVTNLTKEEATTILTQNKIKYIFEEEPTLDQTLNNIVTNQEISPNTYIKKSKQITITISIYQQENNTHNIQQDNDKNLITIPNLIGKTKEDAITILEEKNLKYTITYVEDDKDNIVIDQNPLENKEVPSTTNVTLYISKSKDTKEEPNE